MAVTDIIGMLDTIDGLQVGDDVDGDIVAAYISAASTRLDALCGPVVQREITDEVHDGGNPYLRLRYRPVAAAPAPTVTEYAGTTATALTAETNATKPADAFLLDPETGKIWRRSNNADSWFPDGRRNIVVTYTAGRFETAADVDARWRQACLQVVMHLWRSEQATGTTTFGPDQAWMPSPTFTVPKRVLDMVADELLPPTVA